MTTLIECMLALFWTGYLALMWRLLRGPVNDAVEIEAIPQGEASCRTKPVK